MNIGVIGSGAIGPDLAYGFISALAKAGGGKVYLLDRVTGREDTLRVFDLKTGKEDWSFSYAARGRVSHPGSRSTPFVDGELVSESDAAFEGKTLKLDSDGPLKIGFGQHDYFNGRMKDVRIYDRVLGAKQIREIQEAE